MLRENFKTILVTGGAGFIGSNFIRYFYHAHPDSQIYNLDLLTYAGNLENLADVEAHEAKLPLDKKSYYFIHGDICDITLLNQIFKEHQFDAVVNFAAETHVDRSIIDANKFIHTNIAGVRTLIEAVRTHKTPRLVHISTDEVYGDIREGQADERSALQPSNPYSSCKAAADLILQAFIRTHKVPAIIVRGSNNYGPYQYPEKFIPLAISNVLEGRKIPVHGTGEHVRSWLHVEDFCRAIDLILHRAPDFEVYNVAGEEKTNLEVLNLLCRELGTNAASVKEHVPDRPGADFRYAPDATKLQKELGWERKHAIATSMGDVVQWYTQNKDWWGRIRSKEEFLGHYTKQAAGQWY